MLLITENGFSLARLVCFPKIRHVFDMQVIHVGIFVVSMWFVFYNRLIFRITWA